MRQSTGKYIKELSQFLADGRNITLICHTNPDGDAIGSMLATYHYLEARDKNCKMISPSTLPDFLSWMVINQDLFCIQLINFILH